MGNNGNILKTTNAGASWTAQSSGTNNWLWSVFFIDGNNGYAVGTSGTILKTANAGLTWSAQSSGTTNWLNSVYFTDANTGYAVGKGGTILKTINEVTPGIEEIKVPDNRLLFFPNPFTTSATLSLAEPVQSAILIIFDISGKETMHIENVTGSEIKITRKNMKCGLYFYFLKDTNGMVWKGKITVE